MSQQPEQTVTILIALVPSNKVAMQVATDGKVLAYVELDRAGAVQISNQLAEMANKLDSEQ